METVDRVLKKRWLILFGLLILASIGGLFIPEPASLFELDEATASLLNKADIAWMITATGLVMLMTPGLSFFYGGMVGSKNVISTMI